MPQASIVEWVAGGTLPRHRRQVELSTNRAIIEQHGEMDDSNDSSCCSTCCNCSGCDSVSVTSAASPSKRVRFKQPKGILKHARKTSNEEHKCCSACTSAVHCNERHTVGKNGKIYGSSKKCAPKGGKKLQNTSGEHKRRLDSPQQLKDGASSNYNATQLPPSPPQTPQTPQQRRVLQDLSSFISNNMSRLILPSRAEVVIREDVLENPSDPRPNAFFDARTGILRVYHGPIYGNPGGSLVPLQAQHVPIGTPAPPTTAWVNPWAAMMGGMNGRWSSGVNQRGGGEDFGKQYSGREGNREYYSNNSNRQRNHSTGKVQHSANDGGNVSQPSAGDSKPMPGAFKHENNQHDNPAWTTTDNNANENPAWTSTDKNANYNSNGDAWGNNEQNNDPPSDQEAQVDSWGASGNDNNAVSGNDDWGAPVDNSNYSTYDAPDNSRWKQNINRYNSTSQSKRLFPDTTTTEYSAGSWGVDETRSPVVRSGNVVGDWGESSKQESWGDMNAAQSTRNNGAETSSW